MKKRNFILYSIAVLILFTMKVYADENYSKEDLERRLDIGYLFEKRERFDIQNIMVTDDIIDIKLYNIYDSVTEENKKNIMKFGGDYTYQFSVSDEYKGGNYCPNIYEFKADSQYVSSRGMLFEMRHKTFLKDGKLMIPLRDFSRLVEMATKKECRLKWIGTEEKIVIIYGYAGEVELSAKSNLKKVKFYGASSQEELVTKLEGSIEIIDDVLYIPHTLENMRYIYDVTSDEGWDEETKTLQLWL